MFLSPRDGSWSSAGRSDFAAPTAGDVFLFLGKSELKGDETRTLLLPALYVVPAECCCWGMKDIRAFRNHFLRVWIRLATVRQSACLSLSLSHSCLARGVVLRGWGGWVWGRMGRGESRDFGVPELSLARICSGEGALLHSSRHCYMLFYKLWDTSIYRLNNLVIRYLLCIDLGYFGYTLFRFCKHIRPIFIYI